jgi:hypothetical protein
MRTVNAERADSAINKTIDATKGHDGRFAAGRLSQEGSRTRKKDDFVVGSEVPTPDSRFPMIVTH